MLVTGYQLRTRIAYYEELYKQSYLHEVEEAASILEPIMTLKAAYDEYLDEVSVRPYIQNPEIVTSLRQACNLQDTIEILEEATMMIEAAKAAGWSAHIHGVISDGNTVKVDIDIDSQLMSNV